MLWDTLVPSIDFQNALPANRLSQISCKAQILKLKRTTNAEAQVDGSGTFFGALERNLLVTSATSRRPECEIVRWCAVKVSARLDIRGSAFSRTGTAIHVSRPGSEWVT